MRRVTESGDPTTHYRRTEIALWQKSADLIHSDHWNRNGMR
jgi:hypothetical protein